jgi:hypothetical protein
VSNLSEPTILGERPGSGAKRLFGPADDVRWVALSVRRPFGCADVPSNAAPVSAGNGYDWLGLQRGTAAGNQ